MEARHGECEGSAGLLLMMRPDLHVPFPSKSTAPPAGAFATPPRTDTQHLNSPPSVYEKRERLGTTYSDRPKMCFTHEVRLSPRQRRPPGGTKANTRSMQKLLDRVIRHAHGTREEIPMLNSTGLHPSNHISAAPQRGETLVQKRYGIDVLGAMTL